MSRQLEQEMETVVKVLQPGPLGIIEHKFSAEEIRKANATVQRAVETWRQNAILEQRNPLLKDYIHKKKCLISFSLNNYDSFGKYTYVLSFTEDDKLWRHCVDIDKEINCFLVKTALEIDEEFVGKCYSGSVPNPNSVGPYEPWDKLVLDLEAHDLISSTNELLPYENSRHTWLALEVLNQCPFNSLPICNFIQLVHCRVCPIATYQ
ncbi:Thioredoxin superfamily protein [Prunus dulcis]|uniref:Thioredoxin superfamily protein n=1 Tax=Prunus dulcis TaxID=3755 RepID=A0A4Y1S0Y8_PRUDU|nr:Thioredoxin superfamily protein [Prunus dulcis]